MPVPYIDFIGSLAGVAKTYPIDENTKDTDHVIYTVPPGAYFVVYHIWMMAQGVVGMLIKSGATTIAGPIPMDDNQIIEWKNSGVPVFRARANGDDLVIRLDDDVQVSGFVTLVEATV